MSVVEDHPADYTGLHAFCFVDHVEPARIPRRSCGDFAKRKPPIMYARRWSASLDLAPWTPVSAAAAPAERAP
jgi:hypothetical protein